MFSPNYGFKPRTRLEMIKEAYEIFKQITGSNFSLKEFQGSNVHLICNIFYNQIEKLEAHFAALLIKQFQYWADSIVGIQGSLGSSYEGWINSFKNLCTSVDIVTSDDTRISTLDEGKRPKPGEIIIYFDNLSTEEKDKNAIHEAFLRCKNVAEPTKDGDKEIALHFSNADIKTYKYFNLEPKDYTKLFIQFKVEYQARSIKYPDKMFKDHIFKTFNTINTINKAFYPRACFDITEFPGVSDIIIKSRLESEQDSSLKEGIKEIALGKKYILAEVKIDSN